MKKLKKNLKSMNKKLEARDNSKGSLPRATKEKPRRREVNRDQESLSLNREVMTKIWFLKMIRLLSKRRKKSKKRKLR